MTVCIATMCKHDGQEAIISASDRMVSMGGVFSGEDVTRKVDPILFGWDCMIAGNNISPVIPILEKIWQVGYQPSSPLSMVTDMVKGFYRQQRLDQIEDDLLGSLGYTWDSFRTHGRDQLGDSGFAGVLDRIRAYDLDIQLLVHGYEEGDGTPHIFTVENPGKCEYYDRLGFWAIGSGQHQALASLFWTQYSRFDPLTTCVAHVLAAKLMAESAVGVGKETWVLIRPRSHPNQVMFLSKDLQKKFRDEFQRLPKFPTHMLPMIEANLKEQKEKLDQEKLEKEKQDKEPFLKAPIETSDASGTGDGTGTKDPNR